MHHGYSRRPTPVSLLRASIMLMVAGPLAILPPHALALPEGGEVVSGEVSADYAGNTLDLTQTSHAAIMNWTDFSIGADEIVNIIQNSPDAALLNRVLSGNPSELLGQLNASGRVFLINPNGVVVGKDASVNAMEFVASALDVADEDFLNGGDLAFSGDSTAQVLNLGKITAANGDVVLIAYQVANAGSIEAPKGVAALAAGQDVVLSAEGDQRILVKTNLSSVATDSSVEVGAENSGFIAAAQAELQAAGGHIYDLAINQTGIIQATGVEHRNGRVLLTAEGGAVTHAGRITARDADGSGGEVLIGGDFQGKNAAIANAARTVVTADASIDVSAAADASADGGRAIIWADEQTDFAGRIDGRAGEAGGDGGFAEVSGKQVLNFSGLVDLTATAGRTGDLLLDPAEAIISTAADDQANGAFNNSVLATALGTANVTVDASVGDGAGKVGDITVNAPVVWTSGNSLTLKAGNDITVNADLTGGTGSAINFQVGYFEEPSSTGRLSVDTNATVTATSVTIGLNPDADSLGIGSNEGGMRTIGAIDFQGVINADTLSLQLPQRGVEGGLFLGNSGNGIGTIRTDEGDSDYVSGNITIADGSGDLNINGGFEMFVLDGGGTLQISTVGDLILESGTVLETSFNDIVLASTGGSFINQAGANAIQVTGTDFRALIYADNPTDSALDGLSFAPVYNKTFAGNAPGAITQTGNRILYSLAPTITLTADDLARLYGAANPTLTFSVTGLVGGDTAAQAFSGTPTLSTTATASDNVGTAAISLAAGTVVASDYDYQIAFAPGTLTINPAPLTIRADDQTRGVGVANPTFTTTVTGLVNGDTTSDLTGLTVTTSADINSIAGTYAIVPAGVTNGNYDITYTNGLLTIGASTVTIRADDFSRFFGDANPTFTGSVSAPTGFDLGLITGLTYSSVAILTSDVGTYAIVPAVDAVAGVTFNLINGTLTINPRLLTITASDVTRLYGADNPFLQGTLTGLASFHTADDIVGLDFTTTATASSNVGTYAITPNTGSNPNYSITNTPGTLTINAAPLTITADDASKTYGDANPTFSATSSGLVLDQSLADLGTLDLNVAASQFTDAGTVAIAPSISGATAVAGNYSITFTPGTFTINPRAVSILIGDASRSYGDANPTFQYSLSGTNPAGATIASLLDTTGLTLATTATAASDAGTYAITGSGISDGNFAVTYVPGTLTVDPAAFQVTAQNASRTYGEANPTFGATTSGLKLTDTLADVLGELSLSTTATAASNAGTYTITASGSATNANYAITFTPGTLTVNRAPLLITPSLSSRLYGDPDPDFAITGTGLVNGDTIDVVTGLSFTSQPAGVGVGSYSIGIVSATAANYTLSFGTGTMNVLPRPLMITANDASREYGEANPTFTASFDNLASFDSAAVISGLSLSTVATATSNVLAGGYGIQVTADANPNYTLTFVPGTLTIDPAPLLLELGDVSRLYGDANPTPTAGTVSGFKLGDTMDTLGLQVVTDATPTTDVGTYAYNATTTNPNYVVNIIGGELTINPAPLSVAVRDVSRVYGDDDPTDWDIAFGGLKFEADRAGAVLVTTPTTFNSDVGSYAFGATLLNSNYVLTGVSGHLFITPRPLDVIASASRVFGDANPTAADFTLSGNFVNGDAVGDVVGFRTSVGLAPDTDVGTYDLTTASTFGLLSNNYTLNSIAASLTIDPRPIDISIGTYERYYGDANPVITIEGTGNIPFAFNSVDEVVRLIVPDDRTVPGNYAIETEIINPNYTVGTLGFGTLVILPRPLTIEIGNVARYYGDENPTFTATFGGIGLPDWVDPTTVLDLDTIQPTDATTNAGHYLISALLSTFDSDLYSLLSFTPGVLSIFPRPVTLNINDAEFVAAFGTDLSTLEDFGSASYSVTGDNFVNGDTAAAMFPNLEYVVSASPGAPTVGVAADLTNYTVPALSAFIGGAAPSDGGSTVGAAAPQAPTTAAISGLDDGDTPDTDTETADFIPVVIGGEQTELEVTTIEINPVITGETVEGEHTIFLPTTTVGVDETSTTRSIGLSGGYLSANPNYVVTAVNNGVLRLRTRTQLEEKMKIAEEVSATDTGVRIISPSEFRSNVGLVFSVFPDTALDMIESHLAKAFADGTLDTSEGGLLHAIFGEDAGNPPYDAAKIRAWLVGIDSNPEKRSLLALAMLDFVQDLQGKNPADYTPGERTLVSAVVSKVQEDRRAFVNKLYAREQQFAEFPNASQVIYGAREELTVLESRAAVAATGFLDFERANMTEDEIRVAEAIQASVLDGDTTSTIGLLEEWFSVRGERRGSALIDGQFEGFLAEMSALKARSDAAQAQIASGTDSAGVHSTGGMQGAHDFVNIEPPYGEFLKETTSLALEAKMARYDLVNSMSGAVAGAVGVAAGTGAASGVSAAGTSLTAAIIPYVSLGGGHGMATSVAATSTATGAASAAAGTVTTVATGAAVFVTASVAVAVAGTITLVQQSEQKTIYQGLMDEGFKDLTLGDIDFSPASQDLTEDPRPEDVPDLLFKTMLIDSLEAMLIGS